MSVAVFLSDNAYLCRMGKRKRHTEKKEEPTYGEFLLLLPLCASDHQEELLARLRKQERPEKLCGVDIPANLNTITYGALDDLQAAASSKDPIGECAKTLLGIDPDGLYAENVNDVFGFATFVTHEIERINKLFASIKPSYSAEEKEAGIESLNFGSFGVLDWYAKRQHIPNQNDVREVSWVRIYQCMKNDNAQNEFERRLSKVYERKSKRKRK